MQRHAHTDTEPFTERDRDEVVRSDRLDEADLAENDELAEETEPAAGTRVIEPTGTPPVETVPAAVGPAGTGSTAPAAAAGGQPATAATAGTTGESDRWREVQAGFVDDPAGAVEQADTLVGEVLDRLVRRRTELADRRGSAGTDTEQLRQLLHGYRDLLHELDATG